jgi:hypothetical protein
LRAAGVDAWADAATRAEPAVPWRVERLLRDDSSSTRQRVQAAGRWLGALHPNHALEQDDGVKRVAALASLDLDATRRAFRERYWTAPLERAM